ncbi:MAG TPA: N-acetylmuramoyl-L-alanine amidase [Mycobacterium sp.]|nr:N-acetylmuramoyl-L-alanine amidase [Mycobacterium sp.]
MTAIMGTAAVTAAHLAAWASSHPDPAFPWPEWDTIAETYVGEGELEGVTGDIAMCQAIHETGWFAFGGDVTSGQFNPAGIGAVGGGAHGASFPSFQVGIRAHIQHLKAYASTAPLNQPQVDPRYALVAHGSCPTWESLDGHWAVPGVGYGESIVALWRSAMAETWMPGATIERSVYDNGSHGGPVTAHDGVVMHVTTNWADPGPFFARPINGASSHFWVRADGEIVQYLPLEVASWAQAAGNYSYVSVETDGTVDNPLTSAQVLSFAAIYAWVQNLQGFGFVLAEVPGQPGLGWHGMGGAAWGGHYGCPGDLRKAQRGAILYIAAGAPTPPPPAPPTTWEVDVQMTRTPVHIPLDVNGNGWTIATVPFAQVVSVLVNGADPRVGGYVAVPIPSVDDQGGNTQIEITHGPSGGAVDVFIWSIE